MAQDDPVAAERFVDDLVRQMYKIAELALSGISRDWIRPSLQAFPYRGRYFYFRFYDDRIVILRVLHGSQDIDRQDFPDRR
ncbi:MAG: type II toxin-antitoxin system RelE/ParE family toxin [bacterium]|nr:type II toxin-antitoxin system RelE/ParE family toxin [bacterium]